MTSKEFKNFDTNIIIRNIQIVAKIRKIKIGELERQIGTKVGYFARFLIEEYATPNLKVIISASRILQCPLDLLVNYDLGKIKQEYKDKFNVLVEKCKQEYKNKLDEIAKECKKELENKMKNILDI